MKQRHLCVVMGIFGVCAATREARADYYKPGQNTGFPAMVPGEGPSVEGDPEPLSDPEHALAYFVPSAYGGVNYYYRDELNVGQQGFEWHGPHRGATEAPDLGDVDNPNVQPLFGGVSVVKRRGRTIVPVGHAPIGGDEDHCPQTQGVIEPVDNGGSERVLDFYEMVGYARAHDPSAGVDEPEDYDRLYFMHRAVTKAFMHNGPEWLMTENLITDGAKVTGNPGIVLTRTADGAEALELAVPIEITTGGVAEHYIRGYRCDLDALRTRDPGSNFCRAADWWDLSSGNAGGALYNLPLDKAAKALSMVQATDGGNVEILATMEDGALNKRSRSIDTGSFTFVSLAPAGSVGGNPCWVKSNKQFVVPDATHGVRYYVKSGGSFSQYTTLDTNIPNLPGDPQQLVAVAGLVHDDQVWYAESRLEAHGYQQTAVESISGSGGVYSNTLVNYLSIPYSPESPPAAAPLEFRYNQHLGRLTNAGTQVGRYRVNDLSTVNIHAHGCSGLFETPVGSPDGSMNVVFFFGDVSVNHPGYDDTPDEIDPRRALKGTMAAGGGGQATSFFTSPEDERRLGTGRDTWATTAESFPAGWIPRFVMPRLQLFRDEVNCGLTPANGDDVNEGTVNTAGYDCVCPEDEDCTYRTPPPCTGDPQAFCRPRYHSFAGHDYFDGHKVDGRLVDKVNLGGFQVPTGAITVGPDDTTVAFYTVDYHPEANGKDVDQNGSDDGCDAAAANAGDCEYVYGPHGCAIDATLEEVVHEHNDHSIAGYTSPGQLDFDHLSTLTTPETGTDGVTFDRVKRWRTSRFNHVRPVDGGDGYIYLFGAGAPKRESMIYLARVPSTGPGSVRDRLVDRAGWRYYLGTRAGITLWSVPSSANFEADAVPVIDAAARKGCQQEVSVVDTGMAGDRRFAMTYTCQTDKALSDDSGRNVTYIRFGATPYQWSAPQKIFQNRAEEAAGLYDAKGTSLHGHASGTAPDDGLGDAMFMIGAEAANRTGGGFGPYMIPRYFTEDADEVGIVHVLSSWNPYKIHLFRATFRKPEASGPVDPPAPGADGCNASSPSGACPEDLDFVTCPADEPSCDLDAFPGWVKTGSAAAFERLASGIGQCTISGECLSTGGGDLSLRGKLTSVLFVVGDRTHLRFNTVYAQTTLNGTSDLTEIDTKRLSVRLVLAYDSTFGDGPWDPDPTGQVQRETYAQVPGAAKITNQSLTGFKAMEVDWDLSELRGYPVQIEIEDADPAGYMVISGLRLE